jgi:type IV pilus assembly protein PilN
VIRINLMPRAEARRQAARQRDRQIGIAIACILALVIVIAELMSRRRLNEAEHTTEMYKIQLAELDRKHKEAMRLEKMRDELRAKLKTIDVLERQRTGPVRVLEDLSDSTPEKLWLTEMRETGGAVSLLGRGLDNQTIAIFMERLEESPYFNQVDLVETKQVEDGKAKLKEFSIRASVLYAGSGEDEESEDAVADPKDAKAKQGAGDAKAGSSDAPNAAPAAAGQSADAAPSGGTLVGSVNAAKGAAANIEHRQDERDGAARDITGPTS